MNGAWQVTVDRDRCIGAGICAGMAPGHFTLAGGKSRPNAETTPPVEVVTDAAESCPAEAIAVRDGTDGHLIAPEP